MRTKAAEPIVGSLSVRSDPATELILFDRNHPVGAIRIPCPDVVVKTVPATGQPNFVTGANAEGMGMKNALSPLKPAITLKPVAIEPTAISHSDTRTKHFDAL